MTQKRISIEAPSTDRPVLPSSQARDCLENSTADQVRCAAMIAALNADLSWRLAADTQQFYVAALLQCGPLPPADAELRRLVVTYHLEHPLVEALRDQAHPQHEVVWGLWCTNALRIIQHQGFGTPGDALSDVHDLAQVALEDLVRALPSFRYASRLSTWAYTVISQSAQRYLRALRMAKRSGPTEPLSRPEALEVAAPEAEQPDAHAQSRVLAELVHAVLAGQPDPRWGPIFQLWMHQDQRLADIGKQIGISGSRVSILLDQILRVLREHPALLAWLNADREGQQAQASGATAQPTNLWITKGKTHYG